MAVIKVPGPISGKQYAAKIAGDTPTVDEQKRIDAFVRQREEAFQTQYAQHFGAPVDTGESTGVLNYLGEIPKGLARGAVNFGESALLGGAAALPEWMETPTRNAIRRGAYDIAPQADIGLENSMSAQLSEGIGSMITPYALNYVPFVGPALSKASMLAAGAGEASENARAAGATEAQRTTAAALGILPGAMDILPVARLEHALGATASAGIKAALGRIAVQGGIEGAQEAAQQVAQNLIAKGVYNPNKDIWEGTGQSAGLGGGTGALVAAIMELAIPGHTRGSKSVVTSTAVPPAATPALGLPAPKTKPGLPAPDTSVLYTSPTGEVSNFAPTADVVAAPTAGVPITPELLDAEGFKQTPVYKDLASGKITEEEARARLVVMHKDPNTPKGRKAVIRDILARNQQAVPVAPTAAPNTARNLNEEQAAKDAAATTAADEQAAEAIAAVTTPKINPGVVTETPQGGTAAAEPAAAPTNAAIVAETVAVQPVATPKKPRAPKVKVQDVQNVDNAAVRTSVEDAGHSPENPVGIAPTIEPTQGTAEPVAGGLDTSGANPVGAGVSTSTQPAALDRALNQAATLNPYPTELSTAPTAAVQTATPDYTLVRDYEDRKRAEIAADNADAQAALDTIWKDSVPKEHAAAYESWQPQGDEVTRRPDFTTAADKDAVRNLVTSKVGKGKGVGDAAAAQKYFSKYRRVVDALHHMAEDIVGKVSGTNAVGTMDAAETAFYAGTGEKAARKAMRWVEKNFDPATNATLDEFFGAVAEPSSRGRTVNEGRATAQSELKAATAEQLAVEEDLAAQDAASEAKAIQEAGKKADVSLGFFPPHLMGRLQAVSAALEQRLATHIQTLLGNNNLRAALHGIARTSQDPRLAKLAMRMRDLVKDTKVRTVSSLTSPDGRVLAAAYDPTTDTILVNHGSPASMTNVTVLHEVAHAITHKALNNPNLPVTQQLTKLFNEAKKVLGTDTVGMDNLHEFVAEAFTNKAFRDALQGSNPEGGKFSGWDRFKNAVGNFLRRIFGAPMKTLEAPMDELDMHLNQLLDTSSDAMGPRPDPEQGVMYRVASDPKETERVAVNLGRAQKQQFAQPTLSNRTRWAERASSIFDRFRDIIPSGALGLLKLQAVADIAKHLGLRGGFELNHAIEQMAGAAYAGDQQVNAVLQAATDFVKRFQPRKAAFDKLVWESTTKGVDPRHPDNYYKQFRLRYAPDGDFAKATQVSYATRAARDTARTELEGKYGKENVKLAGDADLSKHAIHDAMRKGGWAAIGKEGQQLYDNMAKFYKARFIELRDGFGMQIDSAMSNEKAAIELEKDGDYAGAKRLRAEGKAAAEKLKQSVYNRFFDFRAIEPYFPLVRKGDYWLEYTVMNPETKEDEKILETFETSYARAQAMAELPSVPGIAMGTDGAPEVNVYRRTDLNNHNVGPADSIFMRDIIQTLASRGVDAEVINDVSKMFIDALPETSFAKSLRKRGNVQGAITDATEAFRLRAFTLSNQAVRYKFATNMRNIIDNIALQVKDNKGALSNDPTRLAVIKELVDRGNLALHPERGFTNDIAKMGTQFAYLQTLGFNASSALIESASIPVVAVPYLGGIYGFGKTTKAIGAAYKLFLNSGFSRELSLMTEYNGKDTADILASPSADNYFVLKMVDGKPEYTLRDNLKIPADLKAQLMDMIPYIKMMADTGNLNRSTTYDTLGFEGGGVATNPLQKIAKGMGYMQHIVTRSNRQVSGMAAYMLELERLRTKPTEAEKGMTDAEKQVEAGKKALYMTTDINGSHTLATGSRFSQYPIGRMIMMYKSYGLSIATLQAKLASQVVRGFYKGATPADIALRKTAFKQLMGLQLSSALIAGISGVPLYGLIKSIWAIWNKTFGDELDDPDTITRDYLSEMVFRGPITDALGLNISSRVGLNDLLIRDNPYLTNASAADYFMGYFGGPVWSTSTQLARGLGEMGSALTGGLGDFQRGVETITPAGLAGPLKTMRYALEGGAKTRRGDPIYDSMSTGELAWQMLGFKPAGLSKTEEVTRELSRENTLVVKEKDDLMRRMNMARRFGDYNGQHDIQEEIDAFNTRIGQQFPKLRISHDTIKKSWDAYKRKTAKMYNGVSFSAATNDALQAMGNNILGTNQ